MLLMVGLARYGVFMREPLKGKRLGNNVSFISPSSASLLYFCQIGPDLPRLYIVIRLQTLNAVFISRTRIVKNIEQCNLALFGIPLLLFLQLY